MDKSRRNIDHLFQEKLQDLAVVPDTELWDTISKDLNKKKQKNRKLLFWVLPTGIAATLIVLLSIWENLPAVNNKIPVDLPQIVEQEEFCPEDSRVVPLLNIISKINDTEIVENNSVKVNSNKVVSNLETKKTNTKLINIVNSSKEEHLAYTFTKIKTEKRKGKERRLELLEGGNVGRVKENNVAVLDSTLLNKKEQSLNNITSSIELLKESVKSIDLERAQSNPLENKKEIKENNIAAIDSTLFKLKEEGFKITKAKGKSPKKWSIQPGISPIIYSSITNGSPIGEDFEDVNATQEGVSYGLKLGYQLSNKWTIRSGIAIANITVGVDNVIASNGTTNSSNVLLNSTNEILSFTPGERNGSILSSDRLNSPMQEAPEEFTLSDPPTINEVIEENDLTQKGEVSQNFSFVELPIEVSYKLTDKKLTTKIIGGVSLFILDNASKDIFFESLDQRMLVGTSESFNKVSYSLNIGAGVDYKFTKSLLFNIEPTLKYQVNTFDDTTNFNPFLFGVFTGVKFIF